MEIVAADGLERLSLAALARSLKVSTPSIYWYFASKEDLLSALASGLFDAAREDVSADLPPQEALLALGRNLLATLRAHPGSVSLITSARLLPENAVPEFISQLTRGGVPLLEASGKTIAVQALVLGWNGFESNPSVHAAMLEMIDPDAAFEAALYAVVKAPFPQTT